jgi:diguanylate cyclase (GGDEF)-like protein
MKIKSKVHFFHFLVNGMLLLGILLSGIVAFSFPSEDHSQVFASKQFLFVLFNIVLLSTIFITVHFLVKKIAQSVPLRNKHIDELTGFMTRHAFGQIFDHIIIDTKRSRKPLTILLVNIDHFRQVNKKHGHDTGDKLLFMLSESIQSVLRASDLTCRWEGDTILVALKNCTERDGCRLAQKMLEKIKQQQLTSSGDQNITITTSIGVAQMATGDDSQHLVIRAETGLHSARDNGRNTYAVGYEWILIDYACNPIF